MPPAATFSPRRSLILIATAVAALPSPALIVWCISLASNTDHIPVV
ncbi:cell growth regulating nucleolar protein LYAR [Fusarium fujikuroi]|nr:cell growth regulating nucleolar protein LYAR [Fusarium fujikuroi]